MEIKNWLKPLFLSDQEKAYAKHYMRTNNRLAIVAALILVLFVMGYIMPSILIHAALSLFGGAPGTTNGEKVASLFISICILAYVLPMYQFRFLMKRSSSDLYLSLPIERKRLFYVHYLIGLLYMASVAVLEYIPVAFYYYGNRIGITIDSTWHAPLYGTSETLITTLLLLVIFLVLGICLYTFFTCFIVRCHTMLDGILICAIYTLLPLIIFYSMGFFLSNISNELLYSVESYHFSYMSPLANILVALTSLPWQMNAWVRLFFEPTITTDYTCMLLGMELLVWLILGVICYRNASNYFVHLKSEDSEQPTKSPLTYPILIPLVTFQLLLIIGKGKLISFMICILFVCYLIAHFFAQRKITIHVRMIAIYGALVLTSSALHHWLVRTNLFAMIYEIPQGDEVELIRLEIIDQNLNYYVSADITNQTVKEDILQAHAQWLPYTTKEQSWNYIQGHITICYLLTNGEYVNRYYLFDEAGITHLQTLVEQWEKEDVIEYLDDGAYHPTQDGDTADPADTAG